MEEEEPFDHWGEIKAGSRGLRDAFFKYRRECSGRRQHEKVFKKNEIEETWQPSLPPEKGVQGRKLVVITVKRFKADPSKGIRQGWAAEDKG